MTQFSLALLFFYNPISRRDCLVLYGVKIILKRIIQAELILVFWNSRMSELLDKKSLGTFMFINIYIEPLCYMTLGVCSQAYSTYPKWQVCNIFAISQKKVKGEVNFLQADKHQMFLQTDTIILDVCVCVCVCMCVCVCVCVWTDMPKLP